MKKTNFISKFVSGALSGVLLAVSIFSISLINPTATRATGASISFTNTVDKAEADRGETLSYTITAKNTGSVDLTNVFVWINQPNLATYVAGSSNYQHLNPNGALHSLTDKWIADGVNFGTLPAGSSVVLKYQTKVAQNANQDDILWSVASVTSNQTSRVQANSWTRAVLKNPALCGEKTADKTSVSVGDSVTFTIKACNTGNIVLHNVYIGDIIQSPFTYVSKSATLTVAGEPTISIADSWLQTGANIGPLNPGQSAFLKFQVTVTGPLTDGQVIQNVAQLKSDETPNIIKCPVVLHGKVLGIVKPPTELPNTGPGDALLIVSGLVPAGLVLRRFKLKI